MTAENPSLVFDRSQLRRQRRRAAPHFMAHDILFQESAAHLIERIEDVKRPFTRVLDIGARGHILVDHFRKNRDMFVVAAEGITPLTGDILRPTVVVDEEYLPFAAGSFDLVTSNLALHWINDLPGILVQIRSALRPDGLFMASLLGGETLRELRTCLMDAELTITGGISPRLSPTIELQMASALLQRTGYDLPVADQETFTLVYPDAIALMHDLRGMGETNAHVHRLRYPTRRAVMLEAARLYQTRFANPAGGIVARFDILFLHGWKPAAPS